MNQGAREISDTDDIVIRDVWKLCIQVEHGSSSPSITYDSTDANINITHGMPVGLNGITQKLNERTT